AMHGPGPLILCYASPETTNGIWKRWRRCAVSSLVDGCASMARGSGRSTRGSLGTSSNVTGGRFCSQIYGNLGASMAIGGGAHRGAGKWDCPCLAVEPQQVVLG